MAEPAIERLARLVWQECSFSALLYRWEELPEDWRENWRTLTAHHQAAGDLAPFDSYSEYTTVESTDRRKPVTR